MTNTNGIFGVRSVVPVRKGGTGAGSASGARTNLGLTIGTDVQAFDAQLADIAALAVTDGNFIVGDGTNWVAESGATARASMSAEGPWTASGAVATTSGTTVSLVSGLSSVTTILIHCDGVSTNTADQAPQIQIGDAGGLELTGYNGVGWANAGTHTATANSSGFHLGENTNWDAAATGFVVAYLHHMGSNIWSFWATGQAQSVLVGGVGLKTLTAALDRVSITTDGGAATFDAGNVYVSYR